MGVFQWRAPVGAVCLVSGLCKNDLYSRHVVSFPTEMSWQGNLAARSSAGCLDPVSIRMKTACYIKPNSFVRLQIRRAQKSRHRKKHGTDICHDIFQLLAQSQFFFFTLNVQKCVSWRYQHTLRKTCLQLAAIKLGGKKLFFVYQNNIWHTLTFEEPCWQMFAVCSNKLFFKVLAMLFTDWKLLYGTNKIRIFTTEWFWFCSLVLYLSFSIFSIYKNLLTDWNLWSD